MDAQVGHIVVSLHCSYKSVAKNQIVSEFLLVRF